MKGLKIILKKGINAWCFPGNLDAESMMNQTMQLGFKGIELNMSEEKEAILHLNPSKSEINDLIEYSMGMGIEISSISTNLLWKYPLTDNREDIRKKGMAIVEDMIKTAHLLHARTILVVPGVVTCEVEYETAYKRAITAIQHLAILAEKYDVTIGIENVWNSMLTSPMEFRSFIDTIGSARVGVYLDIGNLIRFGFPKQWIKTLSSKIVAVHVKDYKRSVDNIEGFVPLLAGDVDWRVVNTTLREENFSGYIYPEIPPHRIQPNLLLKSTSNILDSIFKF